MPVHLRGDPRIRVAQDALHGEGVYAGVEQEAGRRVAQIVKPEVPRDRARPHLHPACTAPAQPGIVVLLHVRETVVPAASAHVLVVRDKSCPGHGTPQDLLELGPLVEHLPIGTRKDVVRAVVAERVLQKGDELVPASSLEEFLCSIDDPSNRLVRFVDSMLPAVLKPLTSLASARPKEKPRQHLEAVLHAYESARRSGIEWVDSPLPIQSINKVASQVLPVLTEYGTVALVHGDAHLRNILLRHGSDPVIVDFAHAGPGHPLFDLVRLEVGVWRVLLKRTDPNVAQASITKMLTHDRIDPDRTRNAGNSDPALGAALRSSMLIRQSCRAVTHA